MRFHNIIYLILLTIFLYSCNQWDPAAGGCDDHGDMLLLTAYSDGFEVFLEASPFVVGHTSSLNTYISHLTDFRPLSDGSVTVSLIVGSDGVRQTLGAPSRPGIYSFRLVPPSAGSGRIVVDINTTTGVQQVVLPDIIVFDTEEAAIRDATSKVVDSIDGVVFTKEQSWKIDFATAEIRREPFGQVIRTIAQVQPSQGDERIITARTSGIIQFNSVVTEGQAVRAGQTLFQIDGSMILDNNLSVRYTEAKGEYERAMAEYERRTELARLNIVSQSELQRTRSEFHNAEIAYTNLRDNFSAGKQNVNSPIGGYVARVLVQTGQFVDAGEPVLIVSQNRDLFIRADLRLRHFGLLDQITGANIRQLNSDTVHTLESLGGRILSFGRSTDLANPLIPITFRINNSARFVPGSFVEMFIKTQTSTLALTVPNTAIVEEMGNYFVFVQLTPEFFDKRPIVKGVTDGIRTEIREGNLASGDRVVSRGAIFVKLAQASGTLDPHAGHAH
jgi:RND family efflux transporter MFP subunit